MRLKKIKRKISWVDGLRIALAAIAMLFLTYVTGDYFTALAILFVVEVVDFMSVEHTDRLKLGIGWIEDMLGVLMATAIYISYVFHSFVK